MLFSCQGIVDNLKVEKPFCVVGFLGRLLHDLHSRNLQSSNCKETKTFDVATLTRQFNPEVSSALSKTI